MNYNHWIIPIFLVIAVGGFYFGKKVLALFSIQTKKGNIIFWTIIYGIVSLSVLYRNIISAWLLYVVMLFFLFDIIAILFRKFHLRKAEKILKKIYRKGIPLFLVALGIVGYGLYNACHPAIREYTVHVSKMKKSMAIGMLSDLHLGTVTDNKLFDHIIKQANSMNVDIFVLVGDIFDEHTTERQKKQAYQQFSQIETKYGVFYVEGNHDLLTTKTRKGLKEYGIQVLEDRSVLVADTFYLVGRKDYRRNEIGEKRKTLDTLLEPLSIAYPIIVLDHQPEDQDLGKKLGVDLQLSGHTHAGQLFPGNFVLQYGKYEEDSYHLIVSSGYGVWNFPVRTAGRSEMVKVTVKP